MFATAMLATPVAVAARPAPSTPSKSASACALGRRTATPLHRRPATAITSRPALRRRGVVVQAALLPTLVPVVGKAIGAFVLFYSSMQWVAYRGVRKDVEKIQEQSASKEEERKARIQKLQAPSDAGKNNNSGDSKQQ